MSARVTICIVVVFALAVASLSAADTSGDDLKKAFANRDLAAVEKTVSAVKMDPTAVFVREKAKQFKGVGRRDAIFAFVRDEVRTEVYDGALRGARGTLLAMAGNPTDKALLLSDLLRGAGLKCRLAQADAPAALRKKIITAMFDLKAKPIAALRKGITKPKQTADPANDPRLLADLKTHVWVQVRDGNRWIDLDPSLRGHAPGTVAVASAKTMNALPRPMFHELTVRLSLLLVKPDGSHQRQVVLERRIPTSELAGVPLALTHKSEGAAVRPGLLWGRKQAKGKPFDLSGPVAGGRGPGGFPDIFGRTKPRKGETKRDEKLVAEILEIHTTTPGSTGGGRPLKRFLLDWRTNRPKSASLDGLSHTVVGIIVLPGTVSRAALNRSAFMATSGYREKAPRMRQVKQQLAAGQTAAAGRTYAKDIGPALLGGLPWTLQGAAETVACIADTSMARMNKDSCTRTYCHRPRVMLATLDIAANQLRFDLGINSQRTVVAPGAPVQLGHAARAFASIAVLSAESQLVKLAPNGEYQCAETILTEAKKQNIPLRSLGPKDAAKVDGLPIAPATRALIKDQLGRGWRVLVMSRPLAEGRPFKFAWYALDPAEGRLLACLPDGSDGFVFDVIHMKLCAEHLNWPVSILIAFDTYLLNYAGNIIKYSGTGASFEKIHHSAVFNALELAKSVGMNVVIGGKAGLIQWMIGVSLAKAWISVALL